MKNAFRKIIACILAIVVVCSTLSFTINMHFCGDTLVDAALFQKAKGCAMEPQDSPNTCTTNKNNCCSEKQLLVKGQDNLLPAIITPTLEKTLDIVSYLDSCYTPLIESVDKQILVKENPSPFVIRQRFKLNESYLI